MADRIREMHATPTAVARAAGIDPKTIRALIRGDHWPKDAIQERIENVLRWNPGTVHARSVRSGTDITLESLTDVELADELARRLRQRHGRESRLRGTDRRSLDRGNFTPWPSAQ